MKSKMSEPEGGKKSSNIFSSLQTQKISNRLMELDIFIKLLKCSRLQLKSLTAHSANEKADQLVAFS